MKKLCLIIYTLTFVLLNYAFSEIYDHSIGSNIRLENLHVSDYEFYVFGIDNSDKAHFKVYDLEGTLVRSTQFGTTFSSIYRSLRSMDVDGDKIVCVYVENDWKNIVTKTSSDGGSNWSTKTDKKATYQIEAINVCIYDNTLYLAYIENQTDGDQRENIRFGKMGFAGSSWSVSTIHTAIQNPQWHGIDVEVIEHSTSWGEYLHILWGAIHVYVHPDLWLRVHHAYSINDGSSFSVDPLTPRTAIYETVTASPWGFEVDMAPSPGSEMCLATLKHNKDGFMSNMTGVTFRPDGNENYTDVEDLGSGYGPYPVYVENDDLWNVYKTNTEDNDDIIYNIEYDPDVGWDESWTNEYTADFQPDYVVAYRDNDEDFIAFGPSANGTNYIFYDDVTPPPAVTISGKIVNDYPKIEWSHPSGVYDIEEYEVWRYRNSVGGGYVLHATVSGTTFTDNIKVRKKSNDDKIYYKVKVVDYAGNESSYSNVRSFNEYHDGFPKHAGTRDENSIPTKFELKQNYPNPFNPVTKIKFDLPEESQVNLLVYNSMGQVVATLLNDHLGAGRYTMDFNADQLPSGVYFYRISAGKFTDVKRMLVIK
ncbi:MAG: T9SS type A sorting domain-containing protein [Calditrichia bacterium]|jgi:hypothetical protein|nr:T9SS type A sorting domain-containing protein [Calditrichia bacterium]